MPSEFLKVEQLRQAQINESGQLGAQAREAAARGNVELAKILLSRALPKELAAPDRLLATSAAAAMVPVFAADTLDVILVGHLGAIIGLSFNADGSRILTASEDKTARLWDASTGLCLRILKDDQVYIHSAAFSADGTRVVASARDGPELAWSASSGAPLQILPNGKESPSVAARHGRNEKRLVVAPEGNARNRGCGDRCRTHGSGERRRFDRRRRSQSRRVASRNLIVAKLDHDLGCRHRQADPRAQEDKPRVQAGFQH